MNLTTPIIVSIAIIIIAFIKRYIGKPRVKPVEEKKKESYPEMEEAFFEGTKNGASGYRVANLYNQYDIMFIKSLLQSAEIPYFIEFENMSRNKGGLAISSYNNAILNILDDDYDDVIQILEEYKKSRKSDNLRGKERIRNVAEIVIGGWAMQSPGSAPIEIKYKRNEGRRIQE